MVLYSHDLLDLIAMPTKDLFAEEEKPRQTSLFPTYWWRKKYCQVPVISLPFMESVTCSGAAVTTELYLGNWLFPQEGAGKSLRWSRISECVGQWGFGALGANEETRAGRHTNKAALLGTDTVFKMCFHGRRHNGTWSRLLAPLGDLGWGSLHFVFLGCFWCCGWKGLLLLCRLVFVCF